MHRGKKYLSIALVAAGFLVVGITLFERQNEDVQVHPLEQQVQDRFALASWFSVIDDSFERDGLDVRSKNLWAIFVLSPGVCPPCLNEVDEYASVLDSISRANKSRDIGTVAVIFSPDTAKAARLAKLSNLSIPTGHGASTKYAKILREWKGATSSQQVVFVDAKSETIFRRVMLLSSDTPVGYKKNVLDRMLASSVHDKTPKAPT